MAGTPFWRQNLPFIVIGLLDVFLIGVAGGYPVLAILYGFGVGWWLVRTGPRVLPEVPPAAGGPDVPRVRIRSLLGQAAALASVTFVVLGLVWAAAVPALLDPATDAAALGVPLILYTSQASKIGWLVLIFVLLPALQFMAVVTTGALALALTPRTRA